MTIDPYSPLAGRKAELLRWLTEEGRFAPDTGRLLELLCNKLAALGIPIARATAHEYRGAARIWRRGESIEIRTTRHGIEFTSDYQNSPIQHVIETGQWLDTMLSETTDRRSSAASLSQSNSRRRPVSGAKRPSSVNHRRSSALRPTSGE